MEKAMAPHSSTLAWKIPWTEEPGRLQSMGLLRVRHDWKKAMAPHSTTFAWRIPWMEEPGRLQSMGSRRVGYDWATSLSLFTFMHGEGNGNPLQCSCLENPRDRGACWAAVYGVTQSRARLKWLSSSRRDLHYFCLQAMGLRRVGHDWATSLSLFTFMHWRRKWQPTPVFLPGESQGGGSLLGCRLWGHTESDTTEVT